MTEEFGGGWDGDPGAGLWVRGTSYVRGYSDARDAAEHWRAAVGAAGLDPEELRAIPSTGTTGQGEVRLRLAPEYVRCLAWLVRYSLEADWGRHRVS
jgi:hypothetical protein